MKVNQTVTIVVKAPFAATEEIEIIERIEGNLIYIKGLDVPFNKITGFKTETFPGIKVYIKEIVAP